MTENPKIKDILELAEIISDLKKDKSVVLCHGVFDLVHVGHIRHFKQAKNNNDILIVTITPDIFVNKGPNRPAFHQELRAEAVASLDMVDFVAINNWPTAIETIKLLKPNFYAKGSEYQNNQNDVTGKISEEEAAIKSIGGKMVFTEGIVFSSSKLINEYFNPFPENVMKYLHGFSSRYSTDDVTRYLHQAQKIQVLVIGEAIIDEYFFTTGIGMTTKDPIVAMRYLSDEKYIGGIVSVANHVANFCDHVGMLAMIGEETPQLEFIQKHIANNIDPSYFSKSKSPTIVKRRYIDEYTMNKLFEVQQINDEELDCDQSKQLCDILEKIIPNYDLVIVVDFGHGMLSKEAINIICQHAKFLVVNTQANAGSRGFNVISKYHRADFICLNVNELFLEERSREKNIHSMIKHVSQKVNCGKIIVTMGKLGCICYDKQEGFFEIPAFAQKVIDRMGSGDAMIAITSLCVIQKAPMEIVGFIGNAVAAQAVVIVGHRSFIEKASLLKSIVTLMK